DGPRLIAREPGGRDRWLSDDAGASWVGEPGAESDDLPTPRGLYVRALVADPTNSSRLWVGGERAPRFFEPLPVRWPSDDAGRSWQPISGDGGPKEVVRGIALDPANPSRVYAAAERLFRSEDGGASWRELPVPAEGMAGVLVDPGEP